ncbi:DgyrCDS9024 [Dimorphilus gyrociliatus]|uniref:DgyrCDS9024 n=1 Tax=Dimorphilus gyrociliatus TaxID=2664684 RepID=A0A7I8VY50_9ANNE|nr:DgyrCDS9024 [Dimorphilus gyrociliatus]
MPVVETASYAYCDAPVSSGPTSSPPADDLNHHHSRMSPIGEKNGVQELRKIISMYLAHVYHSDEKRMGKRKMKNLWDKAPDDWPEGIPFVDPNNGLKEDNGKQLKPKKHDLVPMYNFLRQKYEASISGTQSVIPTGEMRGSYMHEPTFSQIISEQEQTTISTHSTSTTMASTFMETNQQSYEDMFQSQLTADSSSRMTNEVTEQGNHLLLMDESEVYGYCTLDPKPKEEDIQVFMKTYKVSPDDKLDMELEATIDEKSHFKECSPSARFHRQDQKDKLGFFHKKSKFYRLKPNEPDFFTPCDAKRIKLSPTAKSMDMDMDMDMDTSYSKEIPGNFILENKEVEKSPIPDFEILLGGNNKPRR